MRIDAHFHWFVEPDDSLDRLFSILDAAGTDSAVVAGWDVLFKQGTPEYWNGRMVELVKSSGGRLAGLATVHLADGDAAIEQARAAFEAGLAGVKLHPWLQGESMNHPTMDGLCELAASWDLPILFHDGTPPNSLPSQVAMVAMRHPNTKFILGHSGILHYWPEAILTGEQCDNVYLTLCGGHQEALRQIVARVAMDRLLWGSDYMGQQTIQLMEYRLNLIDRLGLSSDQQNQLFYQTAAQLFPGLM